MSYSYANRKRAESAVPQRKETAPQPSADALRSGAAQPTPEQMGHRVDLPDVMRAKMENAFGANLSAVTLYESQAVADAGAEAVTRGSDIAFAPGVLDFSSHSGQSLLGHEISHVVSQARGEVTGGGFLNDRALEARADREGAMAAAGQQIAMPTAAMSPISAGTAAGPMQAKKKEEDIQISNPTPVTQATSSNATASAAAKTDAAPKPHKLPPGPPPPPPAAKQAAAKPAAEEAAKAAEPAKKTPPPPPTTAKPDMAKVQAALAKQAAAKSAAAETAKPAAAETAKPAAAEPAKAAAPAIPATRPAAKKATAPVQPVKPAAAPPTKAPGAKTAAPAIPATRPAAKKATTPAQPVRPAAAPPTKTTGAKAATPAKRQPPSRPAPTAPPTRQQAATAPAAPQEEDNGDIKASDIVEAVTSLPEQANGAAETLGDLLEDDGISSALAKRHGEDEMEAFGDKLGTFTDTTGLISNSIGTFSSAKEIREKLAAVEEAKKTGSKRDITDARFEVTDQVAELADNALGAMESGTNLAAKAAKDAGRTAGRFGSNALEAAGETMGTLGDVGSLLTGVYGMGKGLVKHKQDSEIRDDMAAGQERLANQQQPLTKNQATLKSMYKMAHMKSSRDVTDDKFDVAESFVDTLGSGVGMATNTVGGGMAVDLLTKMLTGGIKGAKNMVHAYQEDQDQREVLDEQIGLSQEVSDLQNSEEAKKFKIDPRFYEQAVIRGKGAGSGQLGELYNMQARKLSDEYMGMKPEDDAEVGKFADAAKVDRTKEKAGDAIYHSIGGTDTEYEDRDADVFKKQADRHQAILKEGGYGKHYAKKIREGASSGWEKFKTGAGNAAGAVKDFATNAATRKKAWETVKAAPGKALDSAKSGWEKFKTGAGNAWGKVKTGAGKAWDKAKTGAGHAAGAMIDFATNAETRKKAMANLKAAPGKALEKIKTGANNAADYAGKVVQFKLQSMREDHENAMDQFNEHRDSFNKMSWLDRAKWTMQNPLARLRMSTKEGQEEADNRMAQKLQAEELRDYAAEQEEKKKKKS